MLLKTWKPLQYFLFQRFSQSFYWCWCCFYFFLKEQKLENNCKILPFSLGLVPFEFLCWFLLLLLLFSLFLFCKYRSCWKLENIFPSKVGKCFQSGSRPIWVETVAFCNPSIYIHFQIKCKTVAFKAFFKKFLRDLKCCEIGGGEARGHFLEET